MRACVAEAGMKAALTAPSKLASAKSTSISTFTFESGGNLVARMERSAIRGQCCNWIGRSRISLRSIQATIASSQHLQQQSMELQRGIASSERRLKPEIGI